MCRVYNQFKKKPMKSILDVIQQDFKLINKRKHILRITLARFVDIYSPFYQLNNAINTLDFITRYSLLKAYYHLANFNHKKSRKYLNQAKIYSNKMGIKLIYNWAEHLEKVMNIILNIVS